MRKTALLLALLLTPALTAQTIINVDASQDRHRINPNVYGVSHYIYPTNENIAALNTPLARYGGNHTSRYNWQQNATNRARDYFWLSVPDGAAIPAAFTDGIIDHDKAAGAQPMITVPMVGWVAKVGPNGQQLFSYPRWKFPNQSGFLGDAGTGFYPDYSPIYGADPNDANVPADHNFQRGFIQHMVQKYGGANAGGVRYYILDNEYSLWFDTHRDVHPNFPNYEEEFTKMRTYAQMIKEVDPNALVVGPEEWGWTAYHWSQADVQSAIQTGEWVNTPDRVAHGGLWHMQFILQAFHEYEQKYGRRLLDVFTVHYYPQGNEYSFSTDAAVQLERNRSTRSLWDPNYKDTSWMDDHVNLVARMRGWVDKHYPGTPIGITEYAWCINDDYVGCATASADVWGIFGRENLDLATRWTTPGNGTVTYKALQMYRNYDGNKSTFGDISVRAAAPNPDNVAAFASIRSSDKAMTVMLINKQLGTAATTTVNLANFTATGAAQRWQLTSSNAITAQAAVTVTNNALTVTLPAQSITLLVIPGNSADVIDPTIAVNSEALNANGTWTFSGTAADAGGIARVTYRISDGASGQASGTTSWTVPNLALNKGWNYVTFTAYDTAGNPKSVMRKIIYQVMAPPPVPPTKKKRSVG